MNSSIFQTAKLHFLRLSLSNVSFLNFSVFKFSLFVFIVCIMHQGFSTVEEEKIRPQINAAAKMYSGNAASGEVYTYVYLCRVGIKTPIPLGSHLEKASQEDCCTCNFCCSKQGGLGIGIVTVDESNDQEFSGVCERTKNIIWSAYSSFGPRERSSDCCGLAPAGCTSSVDSSYTFKYTFGANYPQKQKDGSLRSPLYREDRDHIPDEIRETPVWGGNVEYHEIRVANYGSFPKCARKSPLEKVNFCDGYGNLRIIRTLGSALFRWKIEGLSITEVLHKIVKLCGSNDEVPQYSYFGVNCGYNCATFAFRSLQALGIPVYIPGWSFGLAAKYLLSVGYCFFQDCQKARSPDGVISLILENYKNSLKQENNQHPEFCIIAFVPRRRDTTKSLQTFQKRVDFLQKTIAEAEESSVKGSDKRFGVFLDNNFR